MPTRALHIHVTGPTDASDHETVAVGCNIVVGLSDSSTPITDSLYPTIDLKPGLLYRTSIEMNVAIADAVKAHLYTSQGIPTNGYAVTYVSGAYGLLSIL